MSQVAEVDTVFRALSDATRRRVLERLSASEASVSELAEPFDMALPSFVQHLKVLEGAGLVTKGRAAQTRPVRLEAEVFDLMEKWIERYRRQAEQRYERLDAVLAEMDGTTEDAAAAGGTTEGAAS